MVFELQHEGSYFSKKKWRVGGRCVTLFRARGAAHWIPEVDSRNLLIGPQLLWLMAKVSKNLEARKNRGICRDW